MKSGLATWIQTRGLKGSQVICENRKARVFIIIYLFIFTIIILPKCTRDISQRQYMEYVCTCDGILESASVKVTGKVTKGTGQLEQRTGLKG